MPSDTAAQCYEVRDPYDLAVVAFALAAACFGFLWWNAAPAKIIMGDTIICGICVAGGIGIFYAEWVTGT